MREMLDLLFRDEGHRTAIAADGREALALVARGAIRPDLIVADYNLPGGITGIELVGELRNARQRAGLPTGFRERQEVTLRTADEGLSAGDLRRLVEALVPVTVVDDLPSGADPVRLVAGGVEVALQIC